jgi:hypothetical protein
LIGRLFIRVNRKSKTVKDDAPRFVNSNKGSDPGKHQTTFLTLLKVVRGRHSPADYY